MLSTPVLDLGLGEALQALLAIPPWLLALFAFMAAIVTGGYKVAFALGGLDKQVQYLKNPPVGPVEVKSIELFGISLGWPTPGVFTIKHQVTRPALSYSTVLEHLQKKNPDQVITMDTVIEFLQNAKRIRNGKGQYSQFKAFCKRHNLKDRTVDHWLESLDITTEPIPPTD